MGWRRVARQFLPAAIVLGGLAFLGRELLQNWNDLRATSTAIDWGQFGLATGLLWAAWTLLSIPTWLAIRQLRAPGTWRQATALFNVSQAPKYLPGGLWALPGRMLLYQRYYRVKPGSGAWAVLFETLALLAGALLVGGWGLFSADRLLVYGGALGLLCGLAVIAAAASQRWLRAWLGRLHWLPTNAFRLRDLPASPIGGRVFGWMTLSLVTFWVLTGLAFTQLLESTPSGRDSIDWYEATSMYALAWSAGFLVILAPAGLGVRESALIVLLNAFLARDDALLLALLARLWWTIAEGIWILIGLALLRGISPAPAVENGLPAP